MGQFSERKWRMLQALDGGAPGVSLGSLLPGSQWAGLRLLLKLCEHMSEGCLGQHRRVGPGSAGGSRPSRDTGDLEGCAAFSSHLFLVASFLFLFVSRGEAGCPGMPTSLQVFAGHSGPFSSLGVCEYTAPAFCYICESFHFLCHQFVVFSRIAGNSDYIKLN